MTIPDSKHRSSDRKPYHLRGREWEIVYLREHRKLPFEAIGQMVGCSGEGARVAYHRTKKNGAPATDKVEPGRLSDVENRQQHDTPDAEGKGNTEVRL